MNLTRRGFVQSATGAGLLLLTGSSLAACTTSPGTKSPQATKSPFKLTTVRSVAGSIWAPVDVAVSQGFFEDEGLENEQLETGQGENAQVVLGGGAQALLSTPASPMKTTMQGQPLVVFASLVTTYAANVVISDELWRKHGLSESSTVEERAQALVGARCGTTGGGAAPDLLFRYILTEIAGKNPEKDAALVPIQGGGSAILGAVKNNQIDAFALASPDSDIGVETLKMHTLFDMTQRPIDSLKDYLYISVAAKPDYIEKNPDAIGGYCRALQRSLNFIKDEPDKFKESQREFYKALDDTAFEASIARNMNIYASSIVPNEAQFEKNKTFLAEALRVQQAGDPGAVDKLRFSEVFNTELAQKAVDAVGLSKKA